ncbi:tRNA (cytosine(38)-C(5))-methyltransferase-like isoform X4 [Mastacembelus armatus]|uniref:tRNA (cytosine(38)-C(5))-methyltransferase-like isoform X4 n=1 Tax=Mastacembelus armatus TaxID=205130 RepID=UPI000E457FDD|nr:tRNA (cytosine(38)-C(5))-methyltransferase-like isoform X4 [Mastacembelus armatus]
MFCSCTSNVSSTYRTDNSAAVKLHSSHIYIMCVSAESGIPAQVVAAIDINTTANQVYRHNFPDTPLWNKTIEGISLDDFNKLSFDMILMSPPCQPFTRIGRQGDVQDPRTKSFLYILDLLPRSRLSRLPRFFLLENVKGFETSSARDLMVQTLKDCGYTFEEIMVSPTSVGIPNSRLRYYLLAKISPENVGIQTSSEVLGAFSRHGESDSSEQPRVMAPTNPGTCQPEEEIQRGRILYKLETTTDAQRKENQNNDLSVRQIQDYLEPQSEINMELYLLPPKTLLRYALLMDIVQPTCRRSTCFTKGYGRYVEGTGSVLQCSEETEMQSVFRGLDQHSEEDKLQRLLKLKLRYFTPREVANLMGFPQSFSFPAQIPTKQQYKVLGNSLNVVVVAKLLRQLVS